MRSVKDLASFIKKEHFKEFSIRYLNLAISMNAPIFKLFPNLSKEEMLAHGETSNMEFLNSLEDGTARERARLALIKWKKNELEGKISKKQIQFPDLILIYSAQKKALLSFISNFTNNVQESIAITIELEDLYTDIQHHALQFFSKIKSETDILINQKEKHLAHFLNALPIGISILKGNGEFYFANETAKHIFDTDEMEDIYKRFKIIDAEKSIELKKEKAPIQIALRGKNDHKDNIQIIGQGKEFFLEIWSTPIFDENGKVIYAIAAFNDITERRKKNQLIKDSELRYKWLINSIKDYGIFRLDRNGYVASWNEGARRIKGYTKEEIIGKHFSIFYSEEDIKKDNPNRELKIAVKEGFCEDEGWRVRKDGSKFWANVLISPIYDEKHQLIGFSKVTRDLTERKKMEDALRSSKDRYKEIALDFEKTNEILKKLNSEFGQLVEEKTYEISLITENIPQLLWTLDGNGKPIQINKQYTKYSGLTLKDVEENKFIEMVHPEDRTRAMTARNKGIERGMPFYMEYRFRSLKGDYNWFLVNMTPLKNENGTIIKWFGSATNIQDKKEQEKYLEDTVKKRTKTLQQYINELEQFTYIASHDLKEPLRAIAGFSDLLIRKCKCDGNSEEYTGFIQSAVSTMNNIIDDLTEYSKIQRSSNFETVHVNDAVRRAIDKLKKEIDKAEAKIIFKNLPDVSGNENQIMFLFYHLIQNSIKFSRENIPPIIEIKAEKKGEKIMFSVKDNGIGIDKPYWGKIFVVFQRLHQREKYKGTGIGLAICKKIVENHDGKIRVESKVNEGSTFYFTLPDANLANAQNT
jgi:PAS domain S-box-containing protein